MGYYLRRRMSLLTFCLCGLFGILPDAEYIIQGSTASQVFHKPLFIASSFVILYLCSYLGRLYCTHLLRRGHETYEKKY